MVFALIQKKIGDKGALEIGSMYRSMLNTIFLDLHFPEIQYLFLLDTLQYPLAKRPNRLGYL